jgi:4-carboxymuconolactone decarboxylase
MSITQAAQANHDELFPDHQSTLKVTDSEFVELFDNFAFDEVIAYGNLSTQTRLKVILTSLIAMQTVSEYKVMLGGALNVGVTPVEVKEIVYQAVPYVGIARAFDFLHATNEILQSREVPLPLEGQSTTTPETRHRDGLTVQKSIFGASSSPCTPAPRRTSCTSSSTCPRTASATTTPGPAWISRRGSC